MATCIDINGNMFGRKSLTLMTLLSGKLMIRQFRWVGSLNKDVKSLVFAEYGDPTSVVNRQITAQCASLSAQQVRVKVLAAPINPADINTIQGVYPIKPTLPAVGGNEGIGEVIEVGSKVTEVKVGDWVIPDAAAKGTWTTEMIINEDEVLSIDRDIGVEAAATIAVNPCTAYRMLHDFVTLKTGDVVIQNGGNSAVGQAVIQIAKHLQVSTVNIVRDRPHIAQLKSMLTDLGATEVFTEEEVRQGKLKSFFSSNSPARLVFNCVGGKQGAQLLRYMAPGSVMVTYGAMSKQPLSVPAGPLIFNDIRLCGFWMTQWNKNNRKSTARRDMINNLCQLVKNGHLTPPVSKVVHIDNYQEAIKKSMEGGTSLKYILSME